MADIGIDNIDQEIRINEGEGSDDESSSSSGSFEVSSTSEEEDTPIPMEAESSFWFNCETRTNLTVVTLLLMLDRRLPLKEFVDAVTKALPNDLFRCVSIKTPDGNLSWGVDPDFDPRLHFHTSGLPAPGGNTELQEFVSDLARTPLNPTKPLWDVYLVQDFNDGGSCACFRFHRALCDGVSLVKQFLERLCEPLDIEGGESSTAIQRPVYSPTEPFLNPVLSGELLSGARKETANLAPRLVEKLTAFGADTNQFKDYEPSRMKQVAWTDPISLEGMRDVRNKIGISSFDLVLAAISGGLREYLERHESEGHNLGDRLTIALPFNTLLPPEQGGNLSPYAVEFTNLFITNPDPVERLLLIHGSNEKLAASPDPLISSRNVNMYSYSNWVRAFFSESVTASVASIPGTKTQLRILGATLTDMVQILPTPGPLELNFTCTSYSGYLRIALEADTDAVTIPGELIGLVEKHLASYCDLEITSHVM